MIMNTYNSSFCKAKGQLTRCGHYENTLVGEWSHGSGVRGYLACEV